MLNMLSKQGSHHGSFYSKILEFQNEISICYEQQKKLHSSSRMSIDQTWVVVQCAIYDTLLPMVKQNVLS
jgi:hypothetical protein